MEKLDIVELSRYASFFTFLVQNCDFWELRGVGNLIRNIVLRLLLTLPLDPCSLYGLRSFYITKIDPMVAKCEAKQQNRAVFSPALIISHFIDKGHDLMARALDLF